MEKMFMSAAEVAEVLGVSDSYAYKLIHRLNKELEDMGCIVIRGRVNTQYFYEQFYGTDQKRKKDD